MHSLLARQIIKHFGSLEAAPAELELFLATINTAYEQADEKQATLENSLAVTSRQLNERNQQLHEDLERHTIVQEALRESEQRAHLLLESSPLPITIFDELGNVEYINPAFTRIFGWQEEEVVGQRINFVPEEYRPSVTEAFQSVLSSTTLTDYETKRLTKNGQLIDVKINATALQNDEKQHIGSIVIFNDITAEKIYDQHLEVQRQFLNQVINLAPNFIYAKDRQGRFTLANAAVAAAYGVKPADMLGKTNKELSIIPQEEQKFAQDEEEVFESGQEKVIEEEVFTDSKSQKHWLRTVKRPLKNPDGTYSQVLSISTDITPMRQASAELQNRNRVLEILNRLARETSLSLEVNTLFSQILQAAAESINATSAYLSDWNMRSRTTTVVSEYISANVNDLEKQSDIGHTYIYTEEEFEKEILWASNPKEYFTTSLDDPKLKDWTRAHLEKFGGYSVLEIPMVSRNGKPIALLELWDSRGPRQFTSEEIELVQSIARQVSVSIENARLFEDLQNSEERLRKFFESSNDAIFIADFDAQHDRIIDANPKACEMLGYRHDEFLNMPISSIFNNIEALRRFASEVLETDRGWNDELTCNTKNGELLFTEVSVSTTDIEDHKYILMLVRDITERKQAEQAAQAQEYFLRQVIDTNPNLVFAKDREGRYTLANQAMAEAFDTTVENLIGKTDQDFSGDIQAVETFMQEDLEVFRTGQELNISGDWAIGRDGAPHWMETTKLPLYDQDGNITQILGVVTDISEHKLAEENLKQRNQVLEIINQLSRQVSLTLDISDILENTAKLIAETIDITSVYINELDLSKETITTLAEHITQDAAAEENLPSVGNVYNLSNFEDTARWLRNPQGVFIIHHDDPNQSERERKYRDDNNIKSTINVPIFYEGRPFGYIEIYESRQKRIFNQSEIEFLQTIAYQIASAINNARLFQALQENEARFRAILEYASIGVLISNREGKITLANEATHKIFGYEGDELVGKPLSILLPEQNRETHHKNEQLFFDAPESRQMGQRIGVDPVGINKSGEIIPLEIGLSSIDTAEGRLVMAFIQDVSERMQFEQDRVIAYERRGRYVQAANEIANKIAAAPDIFELYQHIVTLIPEKLGLTYAQLLRYNAASDALVLAAGTGEIGKQLLTRGYQIPLHKGIIGKSAAETRTIVISDTLEEPTWNPTPNIGETRSELATPVMLGDELLGVLDVQSSTPEVMNTDLQLVLEVLAGQIAVAVESIRLRAEMEERLRELNALQRMTTSEGWQSYQDVSAFGQKTYAFDITKSETVELDAESDFAAEDKPTKRQPVAVRGEMIGQITIQEDIDRPLTTDEEELLNAITEEVAEALERARLFEASRRSAAELAVLNEMGNAFTEALDVTSITENIYTYASRLIEIHDFYVAFYIAADRQITFPLAIVNNERITEDHPAADFWQPRSLEDGGLTGHIITTRQPILIENNAEEVLEELGIDYNRYGDLTQSWVGVPMAIGDRMIGIITAQSDTTSGLYNNHHLELLTSIASQAAIAIDNARRFQLEQARAQQERLVRTITDKVRSGTDVKSIMRIAIEELSNVLEADTGVIRLGTREQLLKPQKNSPVVVTQIEAQKEINEDDSLD